MSLKIDKALAPRFALLCLGIWLNAADTLVTATIMPSVAREIGGYQYFGWSVAAYLTGSIVAGACSGKLSMSLGLRAATALTGLTYAVGCAMSALAPEFSRTLFPWILLPALPAEGGLALWLAIMGVNAAKWREQAGEG